VVYGGLYDLYVLDMERGDGVIVGGGGGSGEWVEALEAEFQSWERE
jgi:hypothetical protein